MKGHVIEWADIAKLRHQRKCIGSEVLINPTHIANVYSFEYENAHTQKTKSEAFPILFIFFSEEEKDLNFLMLQEKRINYYYVWWMYFECVFVVMHDMMIANDRDKEKLVAEIRNRRDNKVPMFVNVELIKERKYIYTTNISKQHQHKH